MEQSPSPQTLPPPPLTWLRVQGSKGGEKFVHMFYTPLHDTDWQVRLPYLEKACIESAVRYNPNHTVVLWTYSRIQPCIDGLKVQDAAHVLPKSTLMSVQQAVRKSMDPKSYFANGLSVFSDIFRVAAVHKFGGWWLDTDVLLLKQLPDRQYAFSTEPRKLTGYFTRKPHNIHFPLQAKTGNFNLGVFCAPAGCDILQRVLQKMLRKLATGRISSALYFIEPFVKLINENDAARMAVLGPSAFCPLPNWSTKVVFGKATFGYEVDCLEKVRTESYGVHFLGPRLKSQFKSLESTLSKTC